MLKPSVRGGFSDRNGISKINIDMQLDHLDERSRNVLVNYYRLILDEINKYNCCNNLFTYVYTCIFCMPINTMPITSKIDNEIIEGILKNWSIDEVLTFFESIFKFISKLNYVSNYDKKIYICN